MRFRKQRGYSLVELVVVVAVLTTLAAMAMPAPSSVASRKLDVAASEVASAIQYAYSEAARTSQPHGFEQPTGTERIRVFRLDTGTVPPTPVYNVYHPVTRQLYDIDLDDLSSAAVDSIGLTATFRSACTQAERIAFDRNGTPWCTNPATVLLESFELTLTLEAATRTVRTDGMTGRVTVQ